MISEIESVLAVIKAYARQKGFSFMEFVDYCIYEETVEAWLMQGMSSTAIKKKVDEQYAAYNEQHKYLSSLV